MDDCIFCRIARGEIPSKRVYEDEDLVAFEDAAPQAPVHILLIPRRHISSLAQLGPEDGALAGRCLLAVGEIARQQGLETGYRVVSNVGADGGQSVPHLHFHLLGGKRLIDRMG